MGKVSSEIRTVKRQLMLEEWEKQVIDCRSSGLTVQEWCRQNGVNDKTYYYRLRQVREKCLEARAEKTEKTSEQENIQSMNTLEYLRHKLACHLSLNIVRNVTLDAHYRWQDRNGTYTNTEGKVVKYASYGVLDARLAWHQPHFNIYVEGNNLLNKEYVDHGSVPQPGIWAIAGIKINGRHRW